MNRAGLIFLMLLAVTSAASAETTPLDLVRSAVTAEVARGGLPVVVFNIDGTILDNSPRSLAIMRDFVESNPVEAAEIADSVMALTPDQVDYYVVDTFKKCGLQNFFLLEAALRYWAENFFTARYTSLDMPITGAVDFVREIHDAGALIVYVSGRNRDVMLGATAESLRAAGFPVATTRTLLILSPCTAEAARLFKRHAYGEISRMGRVVGAFDDDAEEVVAMKRHWPEAEVVFFRTAASRVPESPAPEIDVVESYTP